MLSPTSTAPVAPVCIMYSIYIDCHHFIYYIRAEEINLINNLNA